MRSIDRGGTRTRGDETKPGGIIIPYERVSVSVSQWLGLPLQTCSVAASQDKTRKPREAREKEASQACAAAALPGTRNPQERTSSSSWRGRIHAGLRSVLEKDKSNSRTSTRRRSGAASNSLREYPGSFWARERGRGAATTTT